MGKLSKVIHTTKNPDLFGDGADNARMLMRDFKISVLERASTMPKERDKIVEEMKKSKKPAEFVLTFDGRMLAYGVRVGSKTWPDFSFDITTISDAAQRRKWMASLQKHGKLVTDAQLAAFDKVNPTPADPEEVAELEKQIAVVERVIKSETDVKSWYAKKYADFDWGQRRMDFGEWAKKQGFGAYSQFMIGVTDGFQDYAMMKTHILKGASQPVKLKAETKAAMEKALAANQKVDYSAAKAEVLAIVDGSLMPKFRALRFKEAEKTVASEKKKLAELKAKLAKLKGRR